MNRRISCLASAIMALSSQSAWSADTFISVFLNDNPMQGIEIRIDDEVIGETNARGFAFSPIEAGSHKVELYRAETRIGTAKFQTGESEDAEISITFTEKSSKPEVSVATFKEDDTSLTGLIGGIVTDSNGIGVSDVTVSVSDGEIETVTDSNGAYELTVPRGQYDVSYAHPDFDGTTISGIQVLANLGASASVELPQKKRSSNGAPSFSVAAPVIQGPVEEVVVLGTYKPSDSGISLERFSTSVLDAIDVETMARFGDGNIASALTRLAGVAVTGDQYANVRGLDGRYLSVSLNNFLMPSTDPLTRDIQLDLFPSGILKGVEVQKSYSPFLLGSTTGGNLGISTKGLPDGQVFSASMTLGGNTEITGDDIITYKGSNGDWITADLGLRSLSDDVLGATENGLSDPDIDNNDPVSVYSAIAYAVAFEDDYNVKSKTANPNFGFGISYGNITDSGSFGYYGSLSYSYDTKSRIDAVLEDRFSVDDGSYDRDEESYSLDAYFVMGSQFRAQDEVLSKTILLRDSTNVTEQRQGIDGLEGNQRNRTYLEWTERQFFSQQFEGKHAFEFGANVHELNWGLAYSNTNLYQPDRREYQYLAEFLILNTLERRWLELDEDSVDFRLDYEAPFEVGSSILATLKAGVLVSDKEREVEQYRFGFKNGRGALAGETVTINDNLEEVFSYGQLAADTYRLDVKTSRADSFDASESINAAYLDLTAEIGDSLTLTAGARQESFEQELSYPNQPQSNNELESDEVLPAFSATYAPNETWQFRAALSQTISYPGIIERSEARMFRNDGRILVGNPNLQPSSIDNADIRVEYYFSDEESLSLALFTKEISDPIELAVLDGSGSATDGNTYRQSPKATLNGVELDGKVNVFDTGSWLGFVSGNLTFIESEVDLNDDSIRLEGAASQGRELQGQSPFLANLQLGLDHFPTEQKVTILLNYFDDRIFIVQRVPRGPMYEIGRAELNINYEKTFDFDHPVTIKAQFKNLLNPDVEFDIDGQVVESFKKGIEYSLDLSWEF